MGKFLVLLLLTAVLYAPVSYAVDPPYFATPFEGYYIPDLVTREKFEFIPGNLVDCKVTYSGPSYSNWECKLEDCEAKVTTGGKTVSFPFKTLYVYEYQYDPKEPSTVNYGFGGNYTEILPDGSAMGTSVNFSFDRQGKEPNMLRGRLNLGIGVGGSIFADGKT